MRGAVNVRMNEDTGVFTLREFNTVLITSGGKLKL